MSNFGHIPQIQPPGRQAPTAQQRPNNPYETRQPSNSQFAKLDQFGKGIMTGFQAAEQQLAPKQPLKITPGTRSGEVSFLQEIKQSPKNAVEMTITNLREAILAITDAGGANFRNPNKSEKLEKVRQNGSTIVQKVQQQRSQALDIPKEYSTEAKGGRKAQSYQVQAKLIEHAYIPLWKLKAMSLYDAVRAIGIAKDLEQKAKSNRPIQSTSKESGNGLGMVPKKKAKGIMPGAETFAQNKFTAAQD